MELPPAPPGMLRSALAAFLLALLLLAGLEAGLRRKGFQPTVTDDKNLWSSVRDQVSRLGPEDVILLGSSRMQLDFALDEARKRYPNRRFLQLAIDGSIPFASLEDLAEHTSFRGTVLCDVHANCIANYGGPADTQAQWLRHYQRDWGLNRSVNRALLTEFQERLVVAGPGFGLNGLIQAARRRRLEPRFAVTRADRETLMDYSHLSDADRQAAEDGWMHSIEDAGRDFQRMGRAGWEADAARVGGLVRTLQARGASVVFARFPTSGKVREADDRLFPRAEFWDAFIQRTGARGLNFADSPALSAFTCGEGSHLDYHQAYPFTAALLQELEQRRLLAAGDSTPGLLARN